MAWLFQGVLNAGLQILLSIFGGWLCARLRLVDPEIMSRNVNAFAMKAAYPAFILHLLGVKTDLRDMMAWRALGVFVLWVFVIHLACYIVHKLRGGCSSVRQLGLHCLLLSTNNTGCIGWPVLIATVGQQSAVLSMLLGVLFFIQLLPVTICCFEYFKWQVTEGCKGVAGVQLDDDAKAVGDQLPTRQLDKACPQVAVPSQFPHEFRYCYWSNEAYQPKKPNPYTPVSAQDNGQFQKSKAGLIEVCVDSGDEDDGTAEHHCFGGGSIRPASRMSHSTTGSRNTSGGGSSSIGSSRAATPKQEWWRSSRPSKPQAAPGGLKRAKDSCDSLYTPFAAAACAAKQQEATELQRPETMGLSTLTRRLSRGLASAAAAAAAAATAAAAAPASLAKAASLHTTSSLKQAASLKKALAPLRRQPAAVEQLCTLSVPLMAEHGDAPSCCPSHGDSPASASVSAADDANSASPASIAADAAVAGSSGDHMPAGSRLSDSSNSSSGGGSSAPVTAATAVRGRLSRLPGSLGQQADSAVELHTMCGLQACADSKLPQSTCQLSQTAAIAGRSLPGGDGPAALHICSSSGDMAGRINSSTTRIDSRTGLLHGPGKSSTKLPSKLCRPAVDGSGSAVVAAAAGPKQESRNFFAGFVKQHPLLCHIVAGQLQSFHLWLNLVAIALSVSGARKYLDPQSPDAIPALGFIDGVLAWFSAACIPTLLFANGVWMCGKDILCGGWRGQAKVVLILLLKLTVLPALMIGLTLLCGIKGEYGLSLVLLASCPLAPLAFLVCQQYSYGAELATSITIQGVLLMLPQMMAIIKINQLGGLYDVKLLASA